MSNKHHLLAEAYEAAVADQKPPRKAEAAPESKPKSPVQYILDQQKLRTRQDLLKLRVAIDSAENPHNPNRELLHDIFREIIKDPNLHSNWESRKMKVKTKPFKVVSSRPEGKIEDKDGKMQDKEDKELTKVLTAPWFRDWIDAVLDSQYWGFTLIEFGPLDTASGEFKPFQVGKKYYDPVTVIDRDNVKPEWGLITSSPGEETGKSIYDPEYVDYLMFVGPMCLGNYGILGKAAKYVLFKDNAMGNWSEWAEVFGMDKRVGYTDADGDSRTRFIQAIQNMGSNAYGVFGSRDKVEYLGTARSDAFQVYNQFISLIDSQTAKLVFGQDVVSNNTGKVVGSVGENIANMYGDSDALMVEGLVNTRLFPLMAKLGYQGFQGKLFKWDSQERLSLSERAEVDFKISQMGKTHSDEYINNTYGVEVKEKEEPEPMGGRPPGPGNLKAKLPNPSEYKEP